MSEEPLCSRLSCPVDLSDMLLYRLNHIRAVGGGVVLRLCEGQFGVTRREWVLLALLHGGPLSPSGLAMRAHLHKSATSKAVVTLVAKGLLLRLPRQGDRRYAELQLSNRGTALFERMMPVMVGINERLLGGLASDEKALLDSLLDRLQRAADTLADDSSKPWPSADRRRGGSRKRSVG